MKRSTKRGRLSQPLFRAVSPGALLVLAAVNLVPIGLVIRQAFSPERESATWPISFLPESVTLENLTSLWETQSLGEHLFLSLWVAVLTTLISLALGFPAGWSAARLTVLQKIATRSALLSRVLPPIAIAIPLTAMLIPLGGYNHPFGFGLVAAHLTIGVPIAILIAFTAFRAIPRELEDAAYVDGCSPLGVFWRVSLPTVKGSVASASILVFLVSWDEFTYALLLQLTNRTMPPLVYYYSEFGQLGAASTLAFLMLLPAVLVIGALQRLLVRGVLAGGVK
ncbi:MAG: carbohydrate ABC transporter permease [Bacteroidota bacterium]